MTELVSYAKAYFQRRIVYLVVTFGAAWVLHSYLLVVVNEGYRPGTRTGNWLNITDNARFAFLAWMVFGGILWTLIFSLAHEGPRKALRRFLRPIDLAKPVIQSAHMGRWGLLAIGAGGGLLLAAWLEFNGRELVVLALFWVYFWSQGLGRRLAWRMAPFFPHFTSGTPATPGQDHGLRFAALLPPLGACAGGLLLAGWRGHPFGLRVGLPLVIAGFVYQAWRTHRGGGQVSVSPILVIWLSLEILQRLTAPESAVADDGGWVEGGGTFSSWWNSEGSGRALRSGLGPAAGGTLGVPLGDALTGPEGDEAEKEPDEIANNPEVLEELFCLSKAALHGLDERERAMWIKGEPGQFGFERWPWSAAERQATWRGANPEGSVAAAHTHPGVFSGNPKPSYKDHEFANKRNVPLYVVHRSGIWKAVPRQEKPVQVAGEEWWKEYKEKEKKGEFTCR